MKKLLVITYYWPPSGGSGVQRWLKFCKYLREFGWEPVVYTPEDPDVDLVDPSLSRDVHPNQVVLKLPIREPRRIYRKITRSKARGQADELLYKDRADLTPKDKALIWARSNFLIPDARALWIKPSIEFLLEYLAIDPVDAMVSTGPPHSMHLIARGVKKKLQIPWVADFRDPWTDIVFYERLPLTRWADRKQKRLEQSVIIEADALVQVAPQWAKRLRMAGAPRVETITNGFDEDEMPEPRVPGTDKFRINHTGSLTADRNHEVFWEALRAVSKGVLGFKGKLEIELVGRVDPSVVDSAIKYGFGGNLVQAGYVPHAQAVDRMASAHCLLLPINRTDSGVGFIPGKLFEYMGSGRPIIVIGPKGGDAERIVEDSRTGVGVGFDDFHNLKSVIVEWYDLAKKRELNSDPTGVEAFTRRNLTAQMAGLLDQLTGGHSQLPEEPSPTESPVDSPS